MGKAKKQRASKVKYAQAKRLISPKDSRLKEVSEKADAKAAKAKAAETRQVTQTPSAMFFKYNTALGPPYFVLVDTNFINFSIKVRSLTLVAASIDLQIILV
jgi:U3 small nucleolar RNA-associated protein 24